jgi:vancomycin resistance protein YoaR
MAGITSTSQDYGRRRDISPWFIRVPILFISGAILLVLMLTILIGLVQWYYNGRVMPGVSAYGVDLGGMTADEARAALQNAFTYDDDTVFTFRDGDRFWQLTAGELGVSIDVQESVAKATTAGHSGNFALDMVDQMLIWLNGHSVSPTVSFDQRLAVEKLMAVADAINQPPIDATLTIDGTTVTATPSQVGRTVDILATLNHLNDTIANLETGGEVSLVITEQYPRIVDAQAAAQKAQAALSGPLTLRAQDANGQQLGPWTATVDQISRLLKPELVANGNGAFVYDVTLDMQVFGGYLRGLAPGLLTTPQNARFEFDEQNGELTVLEPGVNGRELNVEQTLVEMNQAVFQPGSRTVLMAFDYTLPTYNETVTAADLGITELVSEATTYYSGSSQARRENIAQAASRFNGVIIAPGEEFSFNQWVGDISPEEGFVEGLVIAGGRTIAGVGGGVCQVSTTAFQAAFYAGYPILERYAHGYQVGYYRAGEGVGMDAAIYTPDLDLRFLNDTEYYLLIETSVYPSNDAVQFRFYSTNPGRQVHKEGPVIRNVQPPAPTVYEPNPELSPGQSLQVDWSAEGADVTVTRIITDMQGNEIDRDEFVSNYQPWGAIIQVAPESIPNT